ncbi:MAG: NAD(P)H-dependent oxidoreductase [Dysgonomonas sp.]|nr:NAD(P)H-dependent oxidoreductase [Dysgonomonas sp.]
MTTIVFAHPWHGSFCKGILDTITKKLDTNNKPYQVIDLNKDNFNPVLTESELALYSKGKHNDPLVEKYQNLLKNSEEVVFIYPIWWMNMPAILKGFFDKVLLYDFAYNYNNGWTPLLQVKKTTVITTSEQDTANFPNAGDPINDITNNCLYSVGISNATWFNCDHITSGSDEHRKEFLKLIENNF